MAPIPMYRDLEKVQDDQPQPINSEVAARRKRSNRIAYLLCFVPLFFFVHSHASKWANSLSGFGTPPWARPCGARSHHKAEPVQLEAHIMSKCPDARDCLRDLILPVMSQVSPKVNFTLSYIGITTEDDGVLCKHGPTECLGNIIELCAANIYPDPKAYLGFTNCLSLQFQDIPSRELVQHCASEHGMDFDKINECASRDDGFGMGLLRDSVERSKKANVGISCTVRLEGKIRCIRDGGEWKDCPGSANAGSLVQEIEALWKEKNKKKSSKLELGS